MSKDTMLVGGVLGEGAELQAFGESLDGTLDSASSPLVPVPAHALGHALITGGVLGRASEVQAAAAEADRRLDALIEHGGPRCVLCRGALPLPGLALCATCQARDYEGYALTLGPRVYFVEDQDRLKIFIGKDDRAQAIEAVRALLAELEQGT